MLGAERASVGREIDLSPSASPGYPDSMGLARQSAKEATTFQRPSIFRHISMNSSMLFAEVLEAADRLPPEEQEDLIAILRRRLAERGRKQVSVDVEDSGHEFAEGHCRPSTVDELMDEILS